MNRKEIVWSAGALVLACLVLVLVRTAMAPAAAQTLIDFLNDSGEKLSSFDLIVTGDLNGDGNVTLVDLSRLKKFYLGIITLQEDYEKAGDANYDNQVSIVDISIMKKVFLGIIKL